MLRALGRRLTYAGVIATPALLLALLLLALPAGSATAAAEPVPGPASETEYGRPPRVTILGVERDPRFGRAWLLARLSGEGHLRTVCGNLKAFAPPGEYEGGFVRIPLIPKPALAKRLRREGRVTTTVTIYFDPPVMGGGAVVERRVTLVRSRPAKPTDAVH